MNCVLVIDHGCFSGWVIADLTDITTLHVDLLQVRQQNRDGHVMAFRCLRLISFAFSAIFAPLASTSLALFVVFDLSTVFVFELYYLCIKQSSVCSLRLLSLFVYHVLVRFALCCLIMPNLSTLCVCCPSFYVLC